MSEPTGTAMRAHFRGGPWDGDTRLVSGFMYRERYAFDTMADRDEYLSLWRDGREWRFPPLTVFYSVRGKPSEGRDIVFRYCGSLGGWFEKYADPEANTLLNHR